MVVDFGQLKDDIKKLADEFDHSLIIEDGTLKEDSRSIERGKFQNDLRRFSSNCREFCKIFL